MYFICHVTQQDHSVEMLRVFMGESSSSHVTILKSLVTIAILIVKGYFRYKTTTSQNVSSEAPVTNFFIS